MRRRTEPGSSPQEIRRGNSRRRERRRMAWARRIALLARRAGKDQRDVKDIKDEKDSRDLPRNVLQVL
jgi:hypothetical protein